MAEVLGASDIVFGKAGPNFLFDSVACQKPFVSMTHIGGQEDGNVELIKKKKLGTLYPMSFVQRYELEEDNLEYYQNTPVFFDPKKEKFVVLMDYRFCRDIDYYRDIYEKFHRARFR